MVESRCRPDTLLRKTGRLGRGVRVEGRPFDVASAGPEPGAADLVGVRFPGDAIGARPLRRRSPREARYRMIEASPPEMHRTGFADETRSEFLKHFVHPREDEPKAMHRLGVIGGVRVVLLKRNWIGYFDRGGPNLYIQSEFGKRCHELSIKLGDALRF